MAEYVSASAIVQSLKGVLWLYTHCCDLQNAADKKYREFGLSIRGLDQAVTRLEKTLQRPNRFHGATNGRSQSFPGPQYDPQLATTAQEIFKEFRLTLMDCELLLNNNASLQSGPANFFQNVAWGALTQDAVDALQRRIDTQIQQIVLVQSSISFEADHNLAEQIQYLAINHDPTYTQERLSIEPFPLPNNLIYRFRVASGRDPPRGFKSPSDFPLDQGFQTLFAHLQQSTTQSPPGARQTIHQYISLLKSQWILQSMKQLPSFKGLPAWHKDKIDAQDFENTIVRELQRPDLTKWDYEAIARLPDSHFFIWDTRPMNVVQDQMNAFKGEKRILSASLPSPPGYSGYELAVFRGLNVASGTGLRLVRKLITGNPDVLLPPEPLLVDVFTDKLIPLYAFARARDERYSLRLQKPGYAEGPRYEFDGIQDVFKLQWALTCYAVASDFENVAWAIANRSLISKTPQGGGSRVQIWLWDPDDTLTATAATASSDVQGDSRSLVSQLTGQSALTILQDSEKPHMSVTNKTQTKYSNTEVVEAVMPYEPLLIIYTKYAGKYSYLCLELSGEIYIDPTNCYCSKKQDKCKRVVFKSRLGPVTLRRVVARTSDIEDVPNLNIFARSFRKGQAAHPELGDDQIVEKITGGHVIIDFMEVPMRQRFNKHFALALKLRQSIESTDKILESRAKYVGDKPEGRGNPRERILGNSRTYGFQSPSVTSVHSDRTPTRNSLYSPQQNGSMNHSRLGFAHNRHDSAVFSAPPSVALNGSPHTSHPPSIDQPLELDSNRETQELECNGNPSQRNISNRHELNTNGDSTSAQSYILSNRGSSNTPLLNGGDSPRTERLNHVWDPDPGGSSSPRSRLSTHLAPPRRQSSRREDTSSAVFSSSSSVYGQGSDRSPSPCTTRHYSASSTRRPSLSPDGGRPHTFELE